MPTAIPSPSDSTIEPIDGHTRVLFVLGDPVSQVRAPQLFNPLFRAHRVNALLAPAAVAPEHLTAFVRNVLCAGNMDGLWLTIPHKASVMHLLDRVDPQAGLAGAVNAVRREADGSLTGALFDGIGLSSALEYFGASPNHQRVLVVGIGGAGMAIATALSQQPLAALALYDRDPARAPKVIARLSPTAVAPLRVAPTADPATYDLVIHATSLGLNADDPLPFDASRLEPQATVVDILMKPQATPLQRACAERGITVHPGFEMLIRQVPEYLRFFGYPQIAAAVEADFSSVRERLLAMA